MWLLIGLILGVSLVILTIWMKGKNMSFRWYEWLMLVIGIILLLFAIQNTIGAFAETENQVAWMLLLLFGLPALILVAITGSLVWMRHRKTA